MEHYEEKCEPVTIRIKARGGGDGGGNAHGGLPEPRLAQANQFWVAEPEQVFQPTMFGWFEHADHVMSRQ